MKARLRDANRAEYSMTRYVNADAKTRPICYIRDNDSIMLLGHYTYADIILLYNIIWYEVLE